MRSTYALSSDPVGQFTRRVWLTAFALILACIVGFACGYAFAQTRQTNKPVTKAAHLYIVGPNCAYVGNTNRDTGVELVLPQDFVISGRSIIYYPDGHPGKNSLSFLAATSGEVVQYTGRIVDRHRGNCAFSNNTEVVELTDLGLVP